MIEYKTQNNHASIKKINPPNEWTDSETIIGILIESDVIFSAKYILLHWKTSIKKDEQFNLLLLLFITMSPAFGTVCKTINLLNDEL